LKKQGVNPFLPVDICLEALASNATFVARSFAGDPKQVKELIKAAFSHHGIAVLDIISPCVTFHNHDDSIHSYAFGKEHEMPLQDISFIPARDEITIEDYDPGSQREVEMHDGSVVVLKKLDKDYDPTKRSEAYRVLEEAQTNNWLVTGLIYINPEAPSLYETYNIDEQLNRVPAERLRPAPESMAQLNDLLF